MVPEVGGPIDPDNEAHDLVMFVFGGMSKGERNRVKIRVRTAMGSQPDRRRLRVGDYRVIYTIDNGELVVRVVQAGHRSTVDGT